MRITWMPRLCIPMKDVDSCDKLRSAARQALSAEDFRMGKPSGGNAPLARISLFFVLDVLSTKHQIPKEFQISNSKA